MIVEHNSNLLYPLGIKRNQVWQKTSHPSVQKKKNTENYVFQLTDPFHL